MDLVHELKTELTELAKLGIGKSRLAINIAYVESRPTEMWQYYNNGMSISDICDHVADLAALQ